MCLDDSHQVSVVEMGISGFGEMRRLTRMVRPAIAVFSVIGDAHLEFLGDREGVMRAKSEIFEGMDANGLAVLNGDDPLQSACSPGMRTITYGCTSASDVYARNIINMGEDGIRMTICHGDGAFDVLIPAFGTHMVYAALASAAVGLELGLTGEEIARGIAGYQTIGDRARVIHANGITIVSDCYNANPNSCRAALDSLKQLAGRRKVCVLGDMLELGPETERMHCGVGEYAARLGMDLVIGCGPLSRHIVDGAAEMGVEAIHFENKADLQPYIMDYIRPGDDVLIKASHYMAFEDIVGWLTGESG